MDEAAPQSRRGAFVPSLVTAAGILIWVTLTGVIGLLISVAGSEWRLPLRIGEFGQGMLVAFALSVAALIGFWLIAPITARLGPLSVVGRSLVAGLIAMVLIWPIEFAILTGYFNQLTVDQAGGLYDLEDLDPISTSADTAWLALSYDLQLILVRLPLYALAALALWLWLRRKENSHGEA
jgi:hypothetical protein